MATCLRTFACDSRSCPFKCIVSFVGPRSKECGPCVCPMDIKQGEPREKNSEFIEIKAKKSNIKLKRLMK